MMSIQQPSSREVAFHEAGHIFVGRRLGKPFISAEIHPERITGRAQTIWLGGQSTTLIEGVTAAAGVCAEAISKGQDPPATFPLSHYGAQSDDEKLARASARTQANDPAETRSEEEIVQGYLGFAAMSCFAEGHWAVIDEIAVILERDEHIDEARVAEVFDRHGIPTGT